MLVTQKQSIAFCHLSRTLRPLALNPRQQNCAISVNYVEKSRVRAELPVACANCPSQIALALHVLSQKRWQVNST